MEWYYKYKDKTKRELPKISKSFMNRRKKNK